jgi:hypothetical protein
LPAGGPPEATVAENVQVAAAIGAAGMTSAAVTPSEFGQVGRGYA